jgi:hypothetical protein
LRLKRKRARTQNCCSARQESFFGDCRRAAHTHMHAHASTHARTRARTCARTHAHSYPNTHTHAHKRARVHTHTSTCNDARTNEHLRALSRTHKPRNPDTKSCGFRLRLCPLVGRVLSVVFGCRLTASSCPSLILSSTRSAIAPPILLSGRSRLAAASTQRPIFMAARDRQSE